VLTGRVAAVGEEVRVRGFGLAGALVFPAETPEQARASWNELPQDVHVVILTPAAAVAVGSEAFRSDPPFAVVMPA
jgi:vacuolar-type H+-ATPase subunit F/Vma7